MHTDRWSATEATSSSVGNFEPSKHVRNGEANLRSKLSGGHGPILDDCDRVGAQASDTSGQLGTHADKTNPYHPVPAMMAPFKCRLLAPPS
jgi:hypothetical protein